MKKYIFATCVLSLALNFPAQAKENTKPKTYHVCKKEDTAENILACNIYREARGESDYGMLAVGFVTLNRKDHEKFPQTVKKIVYQPGQFSWTATSGTFKVHDKNSWDKAKEFAKVLIQIHNNNRIVYDAMDVTKGSTYYHAKKIKPYWTKVMIRTVRIDNHIFYKEKQDEQGA